MTDQQQQEREAFEAWYRANWSDRFGTAICDASWAIWRAAWQARASLAVQPAVVPAGGVPLLVGVDRAEGVDTTVTAYKCQGCGCINVVSESVVPARPVGDTELAALLKRADETITQLEYHRETHRQWAECDLSHNAANPQIGDNAWHAEVVKDYDRMLATVRDLRLRAATAAGERQMPIPQSRHEADVMLTALVALYPDLLRTAPPEQGWREDALRRLAREVMDWHSDPKSSDYNECDKEPCMWCEQADAAMKSPQGDPDDFNDTDKNEGLPPWA